LYAPPEMESWKMYELFEVAMRAGVPAWEFLERPAAYYEGYRQAMEIDNHIQNLIYKRGSNA